MTGECHGHSGGLIECAGVFSRLVQGAKSQQKFAMWTELEDRMPADVGYPDIVRMVDMNSVEPILTTDRGRRILPYVIHHRLLEHAITQRTGEVALLVKDDNRVVPRCAT